MAYCPKCQKEISTMARACEHCGYDFLIPTRKQPRGWAYGSFATVSIAVAQTVCVLYVVIELIVVVMSVVHGEFVRAILSFMAVIVAIGLVAALDRVQDLE